MSKWALEDNTNGKNGGFLRITRDGKPVVDAFPYARGADGAWVREQAQRIVETMNEADEDPIGEVVYGVDRVK